MEPVNLLDYEDAARAKLPPETFDFIAGGGGDEITLRENRAAFDRIFLRPRAFVDVTSIDMSTAVLGQRVAFPVLLAPVGLLGMAHKDGDLAVARAAAAAGTIMALSTVSSFSIEDVAAAAPAPRWFQLYTYDEATTRRLVERAEAAGYGAIVMTGDSPRLGRRERDVRNEIGLVQQYVPAVNLEGSGFTGPLPVHRPRSWKDADAVRGMTSLPLLIKGVMTAEDAVLSLEHGAAAVIVSNHGGRQLDGVPATIDVLEEVVDVIGGRAEVLLDGGVRRGTDVLKALALGARAVMIGRPYVYGLAVAGQAGVERVLTILRDELELAMALAGCTSVGAADRSLIWRPRV